MGASQGKKKQAVAATSAKLPIETNINPGNQGRNNAAAAQPIMEDADVTLDPQSSAALGSLGERLAKQRSGRGQGNIMPWNEDDDDEMNDREGVQRPPMRNKSSIDSGVLMSPMNTNMSGKRSTRPANGGGEDSFDDIEQ